MGGFLSSLFGGQNTTLNKDMAQEGNLAGFSTGIGEKDTGAASKFYTDILSDNAATMSSALAPEIGAAKTQAQQDAKTASEFGTRSGGTAASNAAGTDKLHAYITNLIGNLKQGAASGAANLGTSNLGMASNNLQSQEQMSQQQMENWKNSILGQGITGAADVAMKDLGMGMGA
jgi:hypothetical protein